MDTIRTQVDTYLQKILELQYRVSEPITHKPTKGELRENFIHRMVLEQFPNLMLKKGILCSQDWQSTQADFLWLKDNARIGNLEIYDLNDCKLFMEIKSCATGPELKAIEDTAELLKAKCSDEHSMRIGMLCYGTTAKQQTVLKKLGFLYDKEIQGYGAYQAHLDKMRHVDFLYSLNIQKNDSSAAPYFVIRDYWGSCTLYKDNPVIQYFLNLFK